MMQDVRTSKKCPRCGETKALDQFIRPRAGTFSDYCHPCRSAKRQAEYRRAGGAETSYVQRLRREYGLSLADYEARYEEQSGRCAVCGGLEPIRGRRLAVDFAGDRVRGLVCSRCIVVVKAVEADPDLLESLSLYIGGVVR